MGTEKSRLENEAMDAILIKAAKIEGIDLEPSPAELDFFLSEQVSGSPVESIDALTNAEERLSEMEAKEQYQWLNRKNANDKFSAETEEMLARKRAELFEKMSRDRSGSPNE